MEAVATVGMFDEDLPTKFEKMLQLCVEHGGDAGGAYFCNPDGLKEYVNEIKDALGLSDYEVSWQTCKYYSDGQVYIYDDYPHLQRRME